MAASKKMKLTVPSSKPRNPVFIWAWRRGGAKHKPATGTRRDDQRELDERIREVGEW